MTELLIAFIAALVLAMLAIPVLSALARRIGLVDHPDAQRKLHRQAIPLVGGVAIALSTIVTMAVLFPLHDWWAPNWTWWELDLKVTDRDRMQLIGLLCGSLVLLMVGVLDDRFGIRGRQKLLGQIVACSILIVCGFQFEFIEMYGYKFEFGSFAPLVSYLWLLGAINSVNLLDGADGFAGTIGALMGLAFCVMSAATGNIVDAVITAAFTGAIIGFLRFNFPPARVYLGDAGSMLIGFLFGALAIRCTFKQASAYAFFGPLALLTIPFLDTTAAIIRRRLTGRSIYSVDRAHLHHTLAAMGFGPRRSLVLVGLLCALSASGGVLAVLTQQTEWAVLSMGAVVAFMISSRLFGFAEFQLLANKFKMLLKSFWSMRKPNKPDSQSSVVQLQGIRDWQLVWQNVREFAEKYDFKTLKMHLHLPWLHEIFHAQYKKSRTEMIDRSDEWYFVIPLSVQNRQIGEVEVVAFETPELTPYETIAQLVELLTDLEPMFIEIMQSGLTSESPIANEESGSVASAATSEDSGEVSAAELPTLELSEEEQEAGHR